MNLLFAFFRLIRWKNLLIVALTQFMVWYFVIYPVGFFAENNAFLNTFNFVTLCLSTIMIAAAGYIINDYFDVKIDLINKPKAVIIEKIIPKSTALIIYSTLNIVALLFAFYLAWQLQQIYLVFFQIICIVLLWFYSYKFKKEFVIGNVIVAFLVAFTILILVAFEPSFYTFAHFKLMVLVEGRSLLNPLGVAVLYAYFAFVITWMREIVKDMEDYIGDQEEGCTTMPIKIGLHKTVGFVRLLGVFCLVPLILFGLQLLQGDWFLLAVYIFIALVLPILYLVFYLAKNNSKKHYHKISKILKLIMLAGVLTLVVYSEL